MVQAFRTEKRLPPFPSTRLPEFERSPPYRLPDYEYKLHPDLRFYTQRFDRLDTVYAAPERPEKSEYRRSSSFDGGRIRHIDLRLSQGSSIKQVISSTTSSLVSGSRRTRICSGDFPEGILPGRGEHRLQNERRAQREALNYTTLQQKIFNDGTGCTINYAIPLRIFGSCKPIVPKTWERASSGWIPRELRMRAQSAPPSGRPSSPNNDVEWIASDDISSGSCYSSSDGGLSDSISPNYACTCHIRYELEEEREPIPALPPLPSDSTLLGFIASLDLSPDSHSVVAAHCARYSPRVGGVPTAEEELHLHRLIADEGSELKVVAGLVLLSRLSARKDLGEYLVDEFWVKILEQWIYLIDLEDCCSDLLKPIITFVENITRNVSAEIWLDDVYKSQVVEESVGKLALDSTRARYCTALLRVLSESACCANMLANTALPECVLLPQMRQCYWTESAFFEEDIFLQLEILRIFSNIALSSGFGRKVIICNGITDTLSRILCYGCCAVQQQASLLHAALCADVTGCEHVTSDLTNARADNMPSVRVLGRLFLRSGCVKVKAATASALSKIFTTTDRAVATKGLTMVHEVLSEKEPKAPTSASTRPKTAPSNLSTGVGGTRLSATVVRDVLHHFSWLCTTAGPFRDHFGWRLMALETVTALLHFPLRPREARPFHPELARQFLAQSGEALFADIRRMAEKHKYVKQLQDKIQTIHVAIIKKTQRINRVSEILDLEQASIRSDNAVLRLPTEEVAEARTELVFCEGVVKLLSVVLAGVTLNMRTKPTDSETLISTSRRQNAQYTTMQDSLYNKYAMSAPGPPSQNSSSGTVGSLQQQQQQGDPEAHLTFVKRILACRVVEMLVPWLFCVYPPITERVVRSLSSLFTYCSVHSLTVYCTPEPLENGEPTTIQPSDVARYTSGTSVTPRQISKPPPPNTPLNLNETNRTRTIPKKGRRRGTGVPSEPIVERCCDHISHLCSRVLTQKLLICNNSAVSKLTALLLRDITQTVTREQLLCLIDDNLLERLTEYIIICNANEDKIFVALDILEALIDFQPSLGKLYHIVGGLNRLVARLLSAGSTTLREKLITIINRLPNDDRWCKVNKADCIVDCRHLDVWHKVTEKWGCQDSVSRLMSNDGKETGTLPAFVED